MTNIVSAHLRQGMVSNAGPLYQYDYGQILRFHGVTIPETYEVHFSNSPTGNSITQIGNADGVSIPDMFLTSGEPVYAWLFLHTGANDGETKFTVKINVIGRARPSDDPPTPEQQSAITEAIAALNEGVAHVDEVAENIPETVQEIVDEMMEGKIPEAVDEWLNDHPEATTTVEDGSITEQKFAATTKEWIRGKRVYNVVDYGAVGDGETDDAPAIRAAIADLPASNWILYFPPGTYLQGDGSSECFFDFTDKTDFLVSGYGAKIVANPLNDPNEVANDIAGAGGVKYRGLKFIGCERGRIEGIYYDGNIIARKPTFLDVSAANDQSAFKLRDCEEVYFVDCTAYGSVMDGFSFGQNGRTYDKYTNHCGLIRCKAYYSYRNGLTVALGHFGLVDSCTFAYSGTAKDENNIVYGTSPKSGADLEAGTLGLYQKRGQEGWVIRNSTFMGNGIYQLSLSYGTYECLVDNCKFIKDGAFSENGIFISKDSEYLTRNNTVKNCYFENCGIYSAGDGLLFEDNVMLNGYPLIIEGNSLYSIGKARKNIVNRNVIRYEFDISQASYTSTHYVEANDRKAYFSSSNEFDYTNNIIINACTALICHGPVDNMVGNVFMSDVVPAAGNKLGGLTANVSYNHTDGNRVVSPYYDTGTNAVPLNKDAISFEKVIKWTGSNSYAVAKFAMPSGTPFVAMVYGAGFCYLVMASTVKRIYGDSSDHSVSTIVNTGGYRYICVKSDISGNRHAKIQVISRYNIPANFDIEITLYNALPTSVANFAMKCPWTNGAYVTALPTGFNFNNGDTALYNTKPIWYKDNHWYYADGTEAT